MAAVPLFGGCAGAAPTRRDLAITSGERTRVAVVLMANQQSFTLQNASAAAKADVYRDSKTPPGLKVIGDARLQALLDVMAENNFFQQAAPVAAADSREVIYVEQGGRRWVLSRRPLQVGGEGVIAAFNTLKTYVLSVYNDTTGFQNSTAVTESELKAERERIRANGAAAKAKAEAAGGDKKLEPPR
jgi:hypothetical protein